MAANLRYAYATAMTITAGGYVAQGEQVGAWPQSLFRESTDPTGELEYEYYYEDTNTYPIDASQCSRVQIKVKDKWEVTVNSDNSLTIKVQTTITDFKRFMIRGNPNSYNHDTRHIKVTAGKGGEMWSNILYDDIGTEHSLPYELKTITRTLEIPAGDSEGKATVYVWNHVNHDPPFPEQEPYLDEMYCGVTFYNLLPKDFGHGIIYHWQDARQQTDLDEWRDENECSTRRITTRVLNRPHWIFKGWATSPNGAVRYTGGESITVCDTVDLYAIWEYTYRPGMVRHNSSWLSCDRDGTTGPTGRCQILKSGKWEEMRIRTSSVGLSDPPVIYSGSWRIMKLIGQDGQPHDIYWDCPHVWPKNY